LTLNFNLPTACQSRGSGHAARKKEM